MGPILIDDVTCIVSCVLSITAQVKHITGTTADIFLEYTQRNLPEGIDMSVYQVYYIQGYVIPCYVLHSVQTYPPSHTFPLVYIT